LNTPIARINGSFLRACILMASQLSKLPGAAGIVY
jgi:hypothetical protein